MAVAIPLVPPGARVKVKRGTLPIEASLIGRTGTVVGTTEYDPTHVDVAMDVTGEIRDFSPRELETLEPFELTADQQRASHRLARP